MRKLILIAAMVLASATAQAGQSRSLTLAANDDQPAAATDQAKGQVKETAKPAEAPKAAETPTYVERPAAVDATTTTQPPKADAGKPVTTAKANKPRHRQYWTEARIIGELHRHGIYW
jgi:hypothetical protein